MRKKKRDQSSFWYQTWDEILFIWSNNCISNSCLWTLHSTKQQKRVRKMKKDDIYYSHLPSHLILVIWSTISSTISPNSLYHHIYFFSFDQPSKNLIFSPNSLYNRSLSKLREILDEIVYGSDWDLESVFNPKNIFQNKKNIIIYKWDL